MAVLNLRGQVGELRIADVAADDLVDRRGRVEHLVERLTGQRRAQHHARAVAARLGGAAIRPRRAGLQISGTSSISDPVVLHVLAVADVGGVAAEFGRDLAENAQLRRAQGAAVAAHPHHEVLGLEDVGVLVTRPCAVVALLTLGVEAHPAHPAAQILLVDAVEALLRVDVDDPRAHVQRVVVLLELLVRVERLAVAERPLALAAWRLTPALAVVIAVMALRLRSRIAQSHRGLSGGADPAAS